MSTVPGYASAAEAAEYLDIDHSQVCRYCTDGRLPAIKVGNQWLIKNADLRKFQKPPRGNPNLVQKGG